MCGWLPRFSLLCGVAIHAGALGCSSGDESPVPVPFTGGSPNAGAGGTPTQSGASMMYGGSASSVRGVPEDIGAAPLAPGGSAPPADDSATGRPPAAGSQGAVPAPGAGGATAEPPSLDNVLVFSRTSGYRHDSIGAGIEAIRTLGQANGFAVRATEDAGQFTDDGLAGFDVVVFLSTTGEVLDDTQQGAFERFVRAGGGWVGVHAAADAEYAWAWYGQLLGGGAWFESHPEIQTVTLNVENATHASTAHLPATFQLQDEWYNFQSNPRPSVNVLLTLDESSYSPGPGAMGADHPIAWFHEFDGGRAFFTALGHRPELYSDPVFTLHLLGGIRWAAGLAL